MTKSREAARLGMVQRRRALDAYDSVGRQLLTGILLPSAEGPLSSNECVPMLKANIRPQTWDSTGRNFSSRGTNVYTQ